MLRLGVTGGIGSGKSTVCQIFEKLGVPVYYADQRSKFLVSNLPELKREIISHFGDESFVDGVYNREYIAGVVFNDKSKLELLNSIIHPYVLRDWDEFCLQNKNSKYIIKEAAIMLETDSKHTVDKIALVYAPQELRLQRVMRRDGLDSEAVISRMNRQMPEEEKRKLADYVIYNDGKHSLVIQVLELHKLLMA